MIRRWFPAVLKNIGVQLVCVFVVTAIAEEVYSDGVMRTDYHDNENLNVPTVSTQSTTFLLNKMITRSGVVQ